MVTATKSAGLSRSTPASVSEAPKTGKKTTPNPRTVVIRNEALPFISATHTARGRYVSTNWFDVPAENYADGFVTGAKVCEAMFTSLRAGSPVYVTGILQGVFAAAEDFPAGPAGSKEPLPSRYGAAAGFIYALNALLSHAARCSPAHHTSVLLAAVVDTAAKAAAREASMIAARPGVSR